MLKTPSKHPQCSYDTNLPQEWVNRMVKQGLNPRHQFVWAYPRGHALGVPYPLTPRATHKFLARHAHASTFYIDLWQICREHE